MIGVPDRPAPDDVDAVVVALKSRTNPVEDADRGVAGSAALAAAGRLPAVLFQVLFDLRLDAARQHRPGGGSADGCPGHRLHHCLPGVPGEPADDLQGLPVRRRRAAERKRHAPPPADADDRRQSGAGSASPGEAQGRPDRLRHRRPRCVPRSASGSRCCAATATASPSSMRLSDDDLRADRRGLRRPAAGHRRVRPGSRPARRTSAARGCWPPMRRPASLPGTGGLRAVIAGSCSTATQQQVALMRERHPDVPHRSAGAGAVLATSSRPRSTGRHRASATSRSWSTPPPGRKR